MKIKIVALLLFIVAPNMGCAKGSDDFEMTVEKTEELKGFILKGIAISGTIKSGCIVNEVEYSIKRDGKEVLKATARILDVNKKSGAPYSEGEAAVKGDKVHLYVPDRSMQDVNLGDTVSSSINSCEKASPKK